jgi:hypothetical protein
MSSRDYLNNSISKLPLLAGCCADNFGATQYANDRGQISFEYRA